MRKNQKLIIVLSFLSLPVMVLFQNCGKTQGFAMTDVTANNKSGAGSTLDTNNLPPGSTTPIDQTGVGSSSGSNTGDSSSSSGSSSGGVNLDEPKDEAEQELEIDQAVQACAALTNSSNSNNINGQGVISADFLSISQVMGKHILSSANFNGNTHISSITNSQGSLTICALEVDTLSNYNGTVILINGAKIRDINSSVGSLFILDDSRARVRNSKMIIHRAHK